MDELSRQPLKGRAAISNESSRFERERRVLTDDGWGGEDLLAEPVRTVASPIRLSKTPVRYDRPPPALGADTEEVLGGLSLETGTAAAR